MSFQWSVALGSRSLQFRRSLLWVYIDIWFELWGLVYDWVARAKNNNTAASWSVAFKINTLEYAATHGDLLYSRYSDRILVYNPETEVWTRLLYLNDSSFIVDMVTCIESLGLLDTGASCDVIEGSKSSGWRKREAGEWNFASLACFDHKLYLII